MDKLHDIIGPIASELGAFETQYKAALSGHASDYQYMIDYISNTSGKHIRPILTLFSAKLCSEINQTSIDYAIVLELLHTSTLIHDDVVDNTLERRGQPSVNAQYDNRAAVLLGDYVLSIAIIRAIATKNQQILEIMGQLAQNLIDGELTQLISSKEHIINESRYFDIIRKKTAYLLSSCTEMGAISATADPQKIEILREVGENLGIIFQIKDDIFDYFEQGDIGKPTGNDIREGKFTLPLIYALKNAPTEEAQRMHELIDKQDYSQENILTLTDFAKQYHGIEYAQSRMQEVKEKTICLLQAFPESATKSAFIELINYIIERKK